VHKGWDGDWEGDFEYLEGILQRHDWGDYAHALMHSQLLAALPKMGFGSKIYVLPSLTIQITPTRFRVPDIAIFDTLVRNEKPVVTTPPWVVIEILSPEDTFMNLDELVAD
jgi:Uma2 family endonuclease